MYAGEVASEAEIMQGGKGHGGPPNRKVTRPGAAANAQTPVPLRPHTFSGAYTALHDARAAMRTVLCAQRADLLHQIKVVLEVLKWHIRRYRVVHQRRVSALPHQLWHL